MATIASLGLFGGRGGGCLLVWFGLFFVVAVICFCFVLLVCCVLFCLFVSIITDRHLGTVEDRSSLLAIAGGVLLVTENLF